MNKKKIKFKQLIWIVFLLGIIEGLILLCWIASYFGVYLI